MRRKLCVPLLLLVACSEEAPVGQCVEDRECPAGDACVTGRCQPRTCPSCAEGEVCVGGQCAPGMCGDEPCHRGYSCVEGACRAADCLEAGCAATQACVRGVCYPRDCSGGLCGASEVCDESGGCTFLGCLGVPCAPDELCADGTCMKTLCAGVICATGAACADGRCVHAACIGVVCPANTLCVGGRCVPVTCAEKPCGPGEVCRDERCWQAGCLGLSCPDQRCDPQTSSCAPCLTQEVHCRDGQDDDCDRLKDCLDPDCWGPEACNCGGKPSEESCGDGLDDDCDDRIDCQDPDCLGLACAADLCTDGSRCEADGTCVPGTPRVCDAPPGACHEDEGTCEPSTGDCRYPLRAKGASCPDDGNPCTRETCDGAGSCTSEPHPDGAPCGPSGQTCLAGACPAGSAPVAGTATVTGTFRVGETLTAVPAGFALGSPAGEYHYSWQRCPTAACASTTAVGSDSATYTLLAADVDGFVRVGIVATNGCPSGCGSSGTAYSAAAVVQGLPPVGGTVALTGTVQVGGTLTAVPSGFGLGTPAGGYHYAWQRCTTAACSSSTAIGGDSASYVLVAADLETYLRVGVTVTNDCASGCGASATVHSAVTSVAAGRPPTAGTASVTGTPRVGQTLTAVPSGFDLGTPAGSYRYGWQRCTTAACTSTTPVGADSATYALAEADLGAYLRVGIVANNACSSGCGASATAYSAAMGAVQGVAPTAGTASVSGTARVGETLTATASGFSLGTPAGGYTYVWQRCTTSACTSTTTVGSSSPTYAVVAADLGAYLRVGIRATNSCSAGCGSSATAWSAATPAVQGLLPVAGAVVLTGTVQVGEPLTAVPSGFSLGTPAGSYHYAWQRCTTAACTSPTGIGGDSASYVLVAADAGRYLRVGVTVTNGCSAGCGSSATAWSPVTSLATGTLPVAGSASVTGTPRVGQTLTATASGFDLGTPAGSYTYAWQRCTTAACTSTTPVGGSSATYALVAADVDAYVRVGIVATNSCTSGCGSSATAWSAATGVVQGLAPTAGTASVTGAAGVGQTLTAVASAFSLGSPVGTYAYTWQRCTTAACTATTPVGGNSATYTLAAADLDAYLRVGITVTNSCSAGCGSSATAYSAATAVVQGSLPTAGTAAVAGTAQVGQTLTASASGFALGTPAGSYAYAWQRCTSSACTSTTPVGGNSATYTLVAADIGAYLRVGITVTNSCSAGCGSSATAYSAATAVVQGSLPTAGTAAVAGTARVGQTLTASASGFTLGTPTGSYTYTWQRCPTSACSSTTTVGSNSTTYTLVAADINAYVRVGIRATNSCSAGCGSSATAYSAATGVVQGTLPTAGTAAVAGTARVGQTLTASASGFTLGTPTGSYTYTWQRCSTSACSSTTTVGSNSTTYALVAADINAYVRVGIRATNSCSAGCGSSATAYSAAKGVVQGIAPSAGSVSVSGTTLVGRVLTASPSGFSMGTPAGSYTYVWQRCTTSACSSTTTVGGNSATYTLASGDAGNYVRVRVYASNSCTSGCGSSSTVSSSALGPIRQVTVSKGVSCQGQYGCSTSACRRFHINAVGFGSSSHTVTCNASNTSNPWSSFTTTTFPVTDRCCYGYPGEQVWVTVDGVQSNTLTW